MRISPDFNREEFACGCGCGYDTVDAELLAVLQRTRDHFGMPIKINSGCRCAKHNRSVGGAPNSQHLLGRAADIVVSQVAPKDVYAYLHAQNSGRYGIGLYRTFVHVDSRSGPEARWIDLS
jgi:uncharacterized protein YcbK (DUF882 family)